MTSTTGYRYCTLCQAQMPLGHLCAKKPVADLLPAAERGTQGE